MWRGDKNYKENAIEKTNDGKWKKKVGFNPVILLLFEKSIQVLERKAHLGGGGGKMPWNGIKNWILFSGHLPEIYRTIETVIVSGASVLFLEKNTETWIL